MNHRNGKHTLKIVAASLAGLAALIMGICLGSVNIRLSDTVSILLAKLSGGTVKDTINASLVSNL